MIGKYSQFYFTKEDPDYSIKGSRDPLGFQVIWQHQAKKLIPYLSTVSANIHDFQILCLAYYFYGAEPDIAFARFFFRFEQLMAYTRFDPSNNVGFNGIDKVRKKRNESNKVSISNSAEDDILSNQRAYGIWGKYNRPFQDIGFLKNQLFGEIFSEKMNSLPEKDFVARIVNKILSNKSTPSKFDVSEITCCKSLLSYTKNEKSFYRDLILKVQSARPYQNELFNYLSNNPVTETLDLYPFLAVFKKSLGSNHEDLKTILEETEFTEKTICPLNHVFRYLQTKPIWERHELANDKYIKKCRNVLEYRFVGASEESKVKNQLIQTLSKDNWEMIEDLVSRNKQVTDWRNGAPWMSISKDILEVHHADGGFHNPDFDPKHDFDNGYFIDTYIGLYHQVINSD